MTETHPGRCLCGAVTFDALGSADGACVCHCEMCRRQGGLFMSARFSGGIEFQEGAALKWCRSSPIADRGFCAECGSTLFWRIRGGASAAISAHAFGESVFEAICEHIFFDDKPDWYDFADDPPRRTGADVIAEFKAATHE